jgi:N-acetyl sugar amidotransferase
MRYCLRCCYPENTKPYILFDDEGVCSGCRTFEQRQKTDWDEKKQDLKQILEKYKEKAEKNNAPFDCIIPVSGGKDSHYQVYLITQIYKMKPLLVAYNHAYNSRLGIRNLNNLIEKFGCDLLRYNTNPKTAKKLSKYMLKKVGDMTWHHHAGIFTFPIQTAVRYNIPLIIWGEHGEAFQRGMHNMDDGVEFTKKSRQEHSMRGFEPEDILNESDNNEITRTDLAPFFYPSDEDIDRVGVRGIYVGNYDSWDQKEHAELMIKKYGFETFQDREDTFNIHSSIDDFFEVTHNYLKYLKFGYGRCTDHACVEIRWQRMKREEGIEMIKKYEYQNKPRNLQVFLEFIGMSDKEFHDSVEHLRDPMIWEKDSNEEWIKKDSIDNHILDKGVEDVRLPINGKWDYLKSEHKKPLGDNTTPDEELDEIQFL